MNEPQQRRGRNANPLPVFSSDYVIELDSNWNKVADVRSTSTYIVRHNMESLIAGDQQMTVALLADISGVEEAAIWHVLYGRKAFNELGLTQIAQALKTDVQELKTQGAFYPVGDEDEINCYTNRQYANSCIMCSPENFTDLGWK